MKRIVAALLVLASTCASAQTLFYYGADSVLASQFLHAYQKNNAGAADKASLSNYLQLYINAKLKIAAAKSLGYDTLPQLVAELDNLRLQILSAYATDKAALNQLVNEAFERSQKDIHLAHIFVACHYGMDTVAAKKKLAAAKAALQNHTAFSDVAKAYSDDPSAQLNGGDLGYITVFTLPYELENLAYTTPLGNVSAVYRSKAGFHIFKNLDERKDIGRIKAAQILLALPPGADATVTNTVKQRADSIYQLLKKGEDFALLAAQFSNDVVSAAANGEMPEFGVGTYNKIFEHALFGLEKDGAITPPFQTSHGYHIVKRLGKTPVAEQPTEAVLARLREQVEQSDRMITLKTAMINKVLQQGGFKKADVNELQLWAFTDSMLNYKTPQVKITLNGASPLLYFSKDTITAEKWMAYAQAFRYQPDGSGIKPYKLIWQEFVDAMALEYYQRYLEDFNPEFQEQLSEFKEGNLFFEIMQRQVWEPAQNDTAALLRFYKEHREFYNWKNSVDAVMFYASDVVTLNKFLKQLKNAPAQWSSLVSQWGEKIAADSGRFETSRITPNTKWKKGLITEPRVNSSDRSASAAYIIRYYPEAQPRSFEEAKGLVITDYQNYLEQAWLAKLRKKYPVRLNEEVWLQVQQQVQKQP